MGLIEAIRAYLRTCPLLKDERLNVDFLPEKAGSYSVDVTPAKEIVKRYIDGSSQRQILFTISSRTAYGEEIRQQIDNLGFYEQLSEWLDAQHRQGNLPELKGGKRAQMVEALTSGYAFQKDADTARYQIQCRLLYHQRRD